MARQVATKRKDGVVKRGSKWAYVIRVTDPETGKSKQLWVSGFPTEKDAKRARDEARLKVSSHSYIAPEKVTVKEFLAGWIDIHAKTKPLKPTTEAHYRQKLETYIYPKLGGLQLQALRPNQIQRFYLDLLESGNHKGKPLATSTVRSCSAIMKRAFRYAVEVDHLLSVNPAQRVPVPQVVLTPKNLWSKDDLRRFLEAVSEHRLGAFYWLATYTGARRGELLGLTWSDVDLEQGKVTFSKSRVKAGKVVIKQDGTKSTRGGFRQRVVPIDPETVSVLKSYRAQQLQERLQMGEFWVETGYVFTQENGEAIYPDTPTLTFTRIRKALNLPSQTLHNLRHFHATALLEAGVPLHVVAERLGHRDAMVTARIYAHVTPEQRNDTALTFAAAMK